MAKTELDNPTTKRIKKVFWRTTYYELTIYMMIGVVGYWSLGDSTPQLVVTRKAIPGRNDIMMVIARIGFTMNLSFCIPLNICPERL